MRGRLLGRVSVIGVAAAMLAPLPGLAAAASRVADRAERAPALRSDFDGDGFADLAVTVSGEDVGGVENAGAVTVIPGSADGLGGPMTTWSQDTPGILGSAASGDIFGYSLATGDFDGDGFADLAIGSPGDDPGGVVDTGAVNVLFGGAGGLTADGDEYWYQDSPAVVDAAEQEDRFGWSLAAADFNGDGFDELAIGAFREDVGSVQDAGAVFVLKGTAEGLTGIGSQLIHQDKPGVPDTAGQQDGLGWSLAAGNLGRGGRPDLAVGTWLLDVAGDDGAGGVYVFYGATAGLTTNGSELWTQNTPGIKDASERPDRFGYSLAIANFGLGPQGDLAVGVPFESVGDVIDAGAVNVIYGSPEGLTADGDQFWSQASEGVFGTTERTDYFGWALAAGNVGKTGAADLVIGVPREDASGEMDTGVVHVLYGSESGLTATGSQLWYQGISGVVEDPEADDNLGLAIAVGSFGRGAPKDLAIGVPSESVGSVTRAGAVNVLYSTVNGLTTTGNELITQDDEGSDEAAEPFDIFGSELDGT